VQDRLGSGGSSGVSIDPSAAGGVRCIDDLGYSIPQGRGNGRDKQYSYQADDRVRLAVFDIVYPVVRLPFARGRIREHYHQQVVYFRDPRGRGVVEGY
jgi:hypothetical protein